MGRFEVDIRQQPRYVDTDKCIACGQCAAKCPKKVSDTYNAGLEKRRAIYVPYSQAVPLKYTIDPDACIYLQKGRCGACAKVCPAGAINFDDTETRRRIAVGSVVLAPGFSSFDPSGMDIYSYDTSPNVVTSLEFERLLSATGPYGGHLVKPSAAKAGETPKKIAWIQCVGSRDINRCGNGYCSSVCCMYALKQAVIAKDHSTESLECTIFYMDLRSQGKDFDKYAEKAVQSGIRLEPARVHSVEQGLDSGELHLRYVKTNGTTQAEDFDIVVLSTGLEIPAEVKELAKRLDVSLDQYGFTDTGSFQPVSTSVPGIYACGAFTGPKDIPHSVMEASSAALAATESLAPARGSLTHTPELPEEIDVTGLPPRIGVFVCDCGINIAGVVRVPEVAEYAKTLPNVAYVEENLFTCSQDTQDKIARVIASEQLNRVVVAACTPRTHEPLFQATLTAAGLNPYLFEMANIRNQDSWVHSDDPDAATQKAKDLVRMSVAKAALLTPLQQTELPVTHSALVVGGGLAGMAAALGLARQGYPVHLVEKSEHLGGNARRLVHTWQGEDIQGRLQELIREVTEEQRIAVHMQTSVTNVDGFVGNFQTTLAGPDAPEVISHGVAIIATGAVESRPDEYLYGEHPAVCTHLELDDRFLADDPGLDQISNAVFIQCVGSRNQARPYCSKVCCTHTLQSAIALKKRRPETNVCVLYRDIRTYGLREELYREARSRGVLFFRYTPEDPPQVSAAGEQVRIDFTDPILERPFCVDADMLCLASAIIPRRDRSLVEMFKVSEDADGWLLEAHQKLRPVDFPSDGVFLCGLAHYPKPIDESMAQAKAAAARALTFLAMDTIKVGGIVSWIDPEKCAGCGGCVEVCPYNAIHMNPETGVAEVNSALCKGCGACTAACPSEAPQLMGFNHQQLYAQISSALAA